MDDFGYKKNAEKTEVAGAARKVMLACATMFSLAVFIYITISAYYFVYQDKESDIETIKSPEGPIKIVEEEPQEEGIKVDHAIYEDIFGNKRGTQSAKSVKIRSYPEPAIPQKKEQKAEFSEQPIKQNKDDRIAVYSEKTEQPKQILKSENDVEKRDNTAAAEKPRVGQKRAIRVQIAAMSSRDSAMEQWQKINNQYPSVFSGLKPFVEKVDLGKRGVFYRLQIGNFSNQVSAEKFCSNYVAHTHKSSADCIIVE